MEHVRDNSELSDTFLEVLRTKGRRHMVTTLKSLIVPHVITGSFTTIG